MEPQTKQQLMQNELVRSATEPDPVAQLPVANLQSTEQPPMQVAQAPVEQSEEEPFDAQAFIEQQLSARDKQPPVEQSEEEPFDAQAFIEQQLATRDSSATPEFNAAQFINDNLPEQKAVTQGYAEDYWRLDTLGKYREHDKYLNAWRNWTGEVAPCIQVFIDRKSTRLNSSH